MTEEKKPTDPESKALVEKKPPAPQNLPALADIKEAGSVLMAKDLPEAIKVAEYMAKSDLVPKDYKGKPANIVLAIEKGKNLGLTVMEALESIAVINGRASLWGQGCASIIVSSPVCEYLVVPTPEEVREKKCAIVKAKRKGWPKETVGTFDAEDAKMGRLSAKDTYQKDWVSMYTWRAFHRATKITFADVLKGLVPREVIDDYEEVGRTENGTQILTPRRQSDVAKAPKEEDIKDAEFVKKEDDKPAAEKPQQQEPRQEVGTTSGNIKKLHSEPGADPKDRIYTVTFEDGTEFKTANPQFAQAAKMIGVGKSATIDWVLNQDVKEIVTLKETK